MNQLKSFQNSLEEVHSKKMLIQDLDDCYAKKKNDFDFDTTSCTLRDGSKIQYADLYRGLVGTLSDVQSVTFDQDIQDLQRGLRVALLNTNIETRHEKIKQLRSELDTKMSEVIDPEKEDIRQFINTNNYTSISWTIIASGVLFFLFSRL